jgi:CheY-like chemotaxis protein
MSRHILVVSDKGGSDHELQRALRKCAAGIEVECAKTRAEISALKRPCLIVLDLMLSTEPAPDVLRWLRDEPLYRDIPVFVLGSEAVKGDVGEAFRLGASSCFLTAREPIEPIADGIATYASLVAAPVCAAG